MSDRDREIERLTEVFKDAILHAPIPEVNPNLIRTVESQARECALRVVGDAPTEQECSNCHGSGMDRTKHFDEYPAEVHQCGYCMGVGRFPAQPVHTKAVL